MPVEGLAIDEDGHAGAAAAPAAPPSRIALLWVLPVVFLLAIWLWLVFSSGGYPIENWVFPMVALGVFGLTVASTWAYPRRPRQLSLAVLALFAAYAIWVLASNLWADSSSLSWPAVGRTFAYLLTLALGLTYFTSPEARRAFRYLLMAAAFVLVAALLWQLWSVSAVAGLFSGNRLAYPIGQPDNAAALFLVLFCPLLWLAAGPNERAPVRGAAIGLATGLLGLALMTQSRSAAWAMGIALVLFFVLSPGRVRLLFYLVVPGFLMVYAFPQLNRYWTLGPGAIGGGSAARTLTVAAIAAGFIGTILALLEDWVKVTARMKAIFGAVILAACVAALVYGAIVFTQDIGGPQMWVRDAWNQLLNEPAATPQTEVRPPAGTGSREDLWKLMWAQLENHPLVGIGADNSGAGPDSFVLQVLVDTGIIGAILAFGAVLTCIFGMLWPRLVVGWRRARRAWSPQGERASPPLSRWGDKPMAYGWQMALFAGVAYWFIEANLQSLWAMTGTTLPALLMLAAGLAATDARAGVFWPGPQRWRRRKPAGPAPEPADTPQPADGPRPAGVIQPAGGTEDRVPNHAHPAGNLSRGYRIALMVVSGAVVVFAASAYLLVTF